MKRPRRPGGNKLCGPLERGPAFARTAVLLHVPVPLTPRHPPKLVLLVDLAGPRFSGQAETESRRDFNLENKITKGKKKPQFY